VAAIVVLSRSVGGRATRAPSLYAPTRGYASGRFVAPDATRLDVGALVRENAP